MARNLDIGLLRAFATVAERRSVTKAAAHLNLSQGAVSQQLARLEALCGNPLLVRDRRGARLTSFGERFLGKARELLVLNDEVWSEITDSAMAGIVRLGAPHDLAGSFLGPGAESSFPGLSAGEQERDWQPLYESGCQDATIAMTRADLAVSVWLAMTVPADLDILPAETGLPALPSFAISLYQRTPQSPAAHELARQIRGAFSRPRV